MHFYLKTPIPTCASVSSFIVGQILSEQVKPRIYNIGSNTNCNTPKQKHNNPLKNYHTTAQEHNRVRGSIINRSDRLIKFHWSEINISQTEPRERNETTSKSPHPNILL